MQKRVFKLKVKGSKFSDLPKQRPKCLEGLSLEPVLSLRGLYDGLCVCLAELRGCQCSSMIPQRFHLDCPYGIRAITYMVCDLIPYWQSNWTLWAPLAGRALITARGHGFRERFSCPQAPGFEGPTASTKQETTEIPELRHKTMIHQERWAQNHHPSSP